MQSLAIFLVSVIQIGTLLYTDFNIHRIRHLCIGCLAFAIFKRDENTEMKYLMY